MIRHKWIGDVCVRCKLTRLSLHCQDCPGRIKLERWKIIRLVKSTMCGDGPSEYTSYAYGEKAAMQLASKFITDPDVLEVTVVPETVEQ